MTKVLILYYSSGGKTQQLANLIARGVVKQNAEAVIRTVPTVSNNIDTPQSSVPANGDIYASTQDLIDCDGLIVGSPTRFGNMAASLKHFIDSTSELWMNSQLAGKPVSFFTSTSSLHGGQESTLLSMMLPFLHHGMLICGLPYSETALLHTQTGGTPYGSSHWSGHNNDNPISEHEKKLALAQGQRVAVLAQKLKSEPTL
ncbi:NAD(P)H:quinone oxidoreductase [Aliikangiella sp. IMCC44359]|uniref:NAD(P)H:quinone oxidoreductase n=1 Tax=Aliikangiella sp. IMCC44359 TaxID=3459125 RepID=UPI00403B2D4E